MRNSHPSVLTLAVLTLNKAANAHFIASVLWRGNVHRNSRRSSRDSLFPCRLYGIRQLLSRDNARIAHANMHHTTETENLRRLCRRCKKPVRGGFGNWAKCLIINVQEQQDHPACHIIYKECFRASTTRQNKYDSVLTEVSSWKATPSIRHSRFCHKAPSCTTRSSATCAYKWATHSPFLCNAKLHTGCVYT